MPRPSLRARIEAYAREEYGIEPEQLPFNHEDYAVLRHRDTGKWFAVFFVKPRAALGLPGAGDAEILSVKIGNRRMAEAVAARPGVLRGYPSSTWNWLSAPLDGIIPLDDLRVWLDESFRATLSSGSNQRVPLPKRAAAPVGRP